MIKIIDATLREGLQSRAKLNLNQILTIAKSISESGIVDQIESGHAAASDEEKERLKALMALNLDKPIMTHARADIRDIDAVIECGVKYVGIFVGVNEISQKFRLNRSAEDICTKIENSIKHAKDNGLYVRFSVEDASRTDKELLLKAYKIAVDCNADRICFSDTVGVLEPDEVGEWVRLIKSNFSLDLEVHLHDDRGLATANSLAAIKAGADWISVSVNGIGERAGITDLCLLMANLHFMGIKKIPPGLNMKELSVLVSSYTRTGVDERRPAIGEDVFSHVARLHVRAIEKNENSYSWIYPEILGQRTKIRPQTKPIRFENLITVPQIRSAAELKYHTAGAGDRYVMINDSIVDDARQYCIVRDIPFQNERPNKHVDFHVHKSDSLFMFIGKEEGLKGLKVEVILEKEVIEIESPASVFIPAGYEHSYNILQGEGLYVNHVLSGDYNGSLLEIASEDINTKSKGWDLVGSKFWKSGKKEAKPSLEEIEIFTSNIGKKHYVAVVGASTKDLIEKLIALNCTITVFDFSNDLLNDLRHELSHHNYSKIEFVLQDIIGKIPENFENKFDFILSDRLVNRFQIIDLNAYYTNMLNLLKNSGELRNSIKIGLYPMDKLLIEQGQKNNTISKFFDQNTRTIDFSKAVDELKEVLIPHGEIDSEILLKWYYFRGKESRFFEEDILSNSKHVSVKDKTFKNQSVREFPDAESTYFFNFKCN